jgi:preprotein translocase subunit SecF
VPLQIVKPDSHWNFLGKRRFCFAISVTLILLGLAAIPIRGLRLGIDFDGGTELQLRFQPDAVVDEGAVRAAAASAGVENPSVVRYGSQGQNEYLLRFRTEIPESDLPSVDAEAAAEQPPAETEEAEAPSSAALARLQFVKDIEAAIARDVAPVSVERVEFVGPKVGRELRSAGLKALGLACVLILIYIAFRFSTRFAPGAVLALVHDVLITSGLWVLFGMEFDLRVLAALLAIIGYSLNDTIIVYDRIRENMALRTTYDLEDVLNQSVNQTLSRTLLTSITTLIALLALFVLGGDVIRPFALAMTLGILVGTYSSVYVAAPALLFLEGRVGRKAA